MSLADFFDRIGNNFATNFDNAGPQGLASLGAAIASAPRNQWGAGIANGMAQFRQIGDQNKKKAALSEALKGAMGDLSPQQRAFLSAVEPDQQASILGTQLFKEKEKSNGPFPGHGFEAAVANILARGANDPAFRQTPEYKLAEADWQKIQMLPGAGPNGETLTSRRNLPAGLIQAPAGPMPAPQVPMAPTQRPGPVAPPVRRLTPPPANLKPDSPGQFFNPDMHPELYDPSLAQPPAPGAATSAGGLTTAIVPGTNKAPIEGQIKNQSFYVRQRAAEKTLQEPGALDDYMHWSNGLAREAGMGFLQGGKSQAVDASGDEWVNALLRPDSGAAIPDAEMARYRATYVPEWGDKPEKLAQKKAARVRAAEATKAGLTPAQIVEAEAVIAKNPNPVLDKWPTPPQGAINMLKMKRDKATFDEKYGPGAADKYLGGK